jgi:hypothetical protein
MREILQKIKTKTLKRRILAMTPSTDILHRVTLINSVMIPLYKQVLMVFPATEEHLAPRYKEIVSFLWTRTIKS